MAGEVSGVAVVADLVAPASSVVSGVAVVADLVPPAVAAIASIAVVADLVPLGAPGVVAGVAVIADMVAPPEVDHRVSFGLTIGEYQLDIVGGADPSNPYTGPVCCEVHVDVELEPVSGDHSHAIAVELQISSGTAATISVRETVDVFGFEPELEDVWFLHVVADGGNGSEVVLRPSAFSGWTHLFGGATNLLPGGSIFFRGDETQFWPADVGAHRFEIYNPGGADAVVTLCLAGAKLAPP